MKILGSKIWLLAVIGIAWGFSMGNSLVALAADSDNTGTVELRVPIGSENVSDCSDNTEGEDDKCQYIKYDKRVSNSLLDEYIKLIYDYGKGIVATLASVMIVWGGIEWATSAGSSEQISSGRDKIIYALIGLGLFILAGLILQTVNPDIF